MSLKSSIDGVHTMSFNRNMENTGWYKKKSKVSDLALLGGPPVFYDQIHVGRPNIGDREQLLGRITNILDSKWFTNNGPYVKEFEKSITRNLGVKHCIAICNGTVALEIAIRALGLAGEVICPSLTFIATAHSLKWQEIDPVFTDIELDTCTIDPEKVEMMITPRTTGIIGVHLWGELCNVEALTAIARKHKLKLLFDAAHAFACSYKGTRIGNFGDAEVFSFHATKFINSFEGGAVVTNDDNLARRIRLMRNFGFSGLDQVSYIGTNGKMSEISAAMGLTSLEKLDDFIETNRKNHLCYEKNFVSTSGIELRSIKDKGSSNYQYVVTQVSDKIAPLERDDLVKILHSENILVRRYFYPGCHRMEPYRSYFPHAGLLLRNTEHVLDEVICFPTGASISEDEIKIICDVVDFVITNKVNIKDALNQQKESAQDA